MHQVCILRLVSTSIVFQVVIKKKYLTVSWVGLLCWVWFFFSNWDMNIFKLFKIGTWSWFFIQNYCGKIKISMDLFYDTIQWYYIYAVLLPLTILVWSILSKSGLLIFALTFVSNSLFISSGVLGIIKTINFLVIRRWVGIIPTVLYNFLLISIYWMLDWLLQMEMCKLIVLTFIFITTVERAKFFNWRDWKGNWDSKI